MATLFRTSTSDEGTMGILVFGDTYVYTIELPWRNNKPNYSCIPAGKYALRMRQSPKYGQCYEVTGVRGRTHILLHHGNFAGDRLRRFRTHSAGCILLGSRRGRLYNQQAVLASKIARTRFELATGLDPMELEIVNA